MRITDISYTGKGYGSPDRVQEKKSASGEGMKDILENRLAECEKGEGAAEASGSGRVSTEDMNLAEYAEYIYDKIERMCPNQYYYRRNANSVFVYISEEGFQAMKDDPEYEAWVLKYIEDDLRFCNSWQASRGGYHCYKLIGATKEECRSEIWYSGDAARNEERYWERRREQKKRLKALLKKQQEKKRLEEIAFEKTVLERKIAHMKRLSEFQGEVMKQRDERYRALVSRRMEIPY